MAVKTTQTKTKGSAGASEAPKPLDAACTQVAAMVSIALTAASLAAVVAFWATRGELGASTTTLHPGFCAADIIKAADAALYQAKRQGRACLCVADAKGEALA